MIMNRKEALKDFEGSLNIEIGTMEVNHYFDKETVEIIREALQEPERKPNPDVQRIKSKIDRELEYHKTRIESGRGKPQDFADVNIYEEVQKLIDLCNHLENEVDDLKSEWKNE